MNTTAQCAGVSRRHIRRPYGGRVPIPPELFLAVAVAGLAAVISLRRQATRAYYDAGRFAERAEALRLMLEGHERGLELREVVEAYVERGAAEARDEAARLERVGRVRWRLFGRSRVRRDR